LVISGDDDDRQARNAVAEIADDPLPDEIRAKAEIDDCCRKFTDRRCHCLVFRSREARSEALIIQLLRYGKSNQGLVLYNQDEWGLDILHLYFPCIGGEWWGD
jgi:hypothetical protein